VLEEFIERVWLSVVEAIFSIKLVSQFLLWVNVSLATVNSVLLTVSILSQ